MRIAEEQLPEVDPVAAPFGAAAAHAVLATRRRGILERVRRDRELRRVVAFLIAGGVSAAVTLTVTSVLTDVLHHSFFWSAVSGTELGIIVNFTINDHLAFRDLAGHLRPLPVRLLRFHITCATGQTIILLLSLLLHDAVHWRAVFAQAVPIVLVTALNFVMHRFWTYRAGHANAHR
ncbi:MAG TPA: GtrA family protein [Ktedonobacterales bacterium]|nr:GtrA family protein [Ktedonobacterales bacterium]